MGGGKEDLPVMRRSSQAERAAFWGRSQSSSQYRMATKRPEGERGRERGGMKESTEGGGEEGRVWGSKRDYCYKARKEKGKKGGLEGGKEGGKEGGREGTVEEPGTPFLRDELRPFLELESGKHFLEGLLCPFPVDHERADRAPEEGKEEGGPKRKWEGRDMEGGRKGGLLSKYKISITLNIYVRVGPHLAGDREEGGEGGREGWKGGRTYHMRPKTG